MRDLVKRSKLSLDVSSKADLPNLEIEKKKYNLETIAIDHISHLNMMPNNKDLILASSYPFFDGEENKALYEARFPEVYPKLVQNLPTKNPLTDEVIRALLIHYVGKRDSINSSWVEVFDYFRGRVEPSMEYCGIKDESLRGGVMRQYATEASDFLRNQFMAISFRNVDDFKVSEVKKAVSGFTKRGYLVSSMTATFSDLGRFTGDLAEDGLVFRPF